MSEETHIPIPSCLCTLGDHKVYHHTDAVISVAVTNLQDMPGDTIIATGSADRTARIWKYNRSTGDLKHLNKLEISYRDDFMHNPSAGYVRVAFDSCGLGTLATTGGSNSFRPTTKVWNQIAKKPHECLSLQDDFYACSVAFNQGDKNIMATGHMDYVKLWNLQSDSDDCLATLDHDGIINSIAFNADGTRLVAGSSNGDAVIWNLTWTTWPRKRSRDGCNVVVTAAIVMKTPIQKTTDDYNIPITSVAFNFDGTLLATGGGNTAKLWSFSPDGLKLKCESTLDGHRIDRVINAVAFHPTAYILATGSDDTTSKLWSFSPDGSNATCVATLKQHEDAITSVAFSPSGHILVTGSSDTTAKLWDCQALSDEWQYANLITRFSSHIDTLIHYFTGSHMRPEANKIYDTISKFVLARSAKTVVGRHATNLLAAYFKHLQKPEISPQGGSKAKRSTTRTKSVSKSGSKKRTCNTLKRKRK
jgi:WD40 repeat protein